MPITFYDPYQAQRQQQAQFQDFVQSLMTSFVLNRMQENLQAKRLENQEKQQAQAYEIELLKSGEWVPKAQNYKPADGEEPPPEVNVNGRVFQKARSGSTGLQKYDLGNGRQAVIYGNTMQILKPEEANWREVDTEEGVNYVDPSSGTVVKTGMKTRVKPPQNAITIDQRAQTAEQNAWGNYLVNEDFKAIDQKAKGAEEEKRQIQIAKNIDVNTGALEPAKANIAKYLQSMGVDPKTVGLQDATTPQAVTAVMNNVVLSRMVAQKGVLSDRDTALIHGSVANLGNTPEAFRFLLDTSEAMAERSIEQRDFYANFRERTGSLNGAAQAWRKHTKDTPLVSKTKTGVPIFYSEWKKAIEKANPGASEEDIIRLWRTKYGGSTN